MKLTEDGGRSWRRIKSPSELHLKTCEDARIETARLFRDYLIVGQCGELFFRKLAGRAPWQTVRSGNQSFIAYELWREGVVAVTSDLEIVQLGPDLSTSGPTGFRLQAAPVDIAVAAGRAVFIDTTGKVTVFDGQTAHSSRILGEGRAETWPIVAADFGPDGVFWGISRYFLYRSADNGKTWERRAEFSSAMQGVAIQGSGAVMAWDRHGDNVRASPQGGPLTTIADLARLDIVGLLRRGSLWLVHGGMQHETTRRVEVARTYFSGQFAGSVDYGFVAVSTDGGDHWKVVDHWNEGGVQSAFLGDDDTLTLLSWLCAIRRGKLDLTDPAHPTARMETILPATNQTLDKVPYVELAGMLDFTGSAQGWVKGWTHHLGDFLYRTDDGGKSWLKVDLSARPVDAVYRLGAGAWVGFVRPATIQILREGAFETSKTFGSEINRLSVDSAGGLLAVLENGEIWRLTGDGKEWLLLLPVGGGPETPIEPAPDDGEDANRVTRGVRQSGLMGKDLRTCGGVRW